ncbi:hypothetical protein PSECIP111951_02860 [Pseudoalteromonas holothuriae]|uniref:Uncharacterized protein n=1 Tax=Pseudoalteromonas holothuriae TaxID=2963714 RepID=A0A9W4VWJ7_9GAMM|nr:MULTISPECIES: thioredoxin family protein [unclassified Pseudoalteromonas]CAH9060030.1 hypothetical protein PSECIP111854_02524 [Pseudoalteromonas sp. CIP111854]CAH9063223.1 hypothetical protein PSECIP111951_02860 [Pseudoalteromonas sp. CIP111951]
MTKAMLLLLLCLYNHTVFALQVQLNNTKELVFIDIWSEYAQLNTLPTSDYPRQFLQPDMNVTPADIAKFVTAYPQYKSLKIDKENTLGMRFGVRNTPTIIRIEQGKVVDKQRLSEPPSMPPKEHIEIKAQHLQLYDLDSKPHNFSNASLTKQLILFADALCPARHLPHCEQKAEIHNSIAPLNTIQKLTVIKPFYISLADLKAYQQRFNVKHPVLLDTYNALFRRFNITSLPYWLLLDKNNEVLYRGASAPSKRLLAPYSNTHSD